MSEAYFQNKIVVPWLKAQGAYVMKTRPGMGTPTGCPDIFFFYQNRWGCIEAKATPSSPYRPGQKETLARLAVGNMFVWRCDPTNWDEVRNFLEKYFF